MEELKRRGELIVQEKDDYGLGWGFSSGHEEKGTPS